MASSTVARLARLIAFDTQNPTGDEPALAEWLGDELRALGAGDVDLRRVPRPGGRDGAFVFATWGRPRVLVNIHIDTVPANSGWRGAPLEARVEDGCVVGLGAADTKGAIAALLGALEATPPAHLAVLLSGDEEHGSACLAAFLASGLGQGLDRAVVCEPTSLRVGTRHRGVLAAEVTARGDGGHSSRADVLGSPVVALARVALALDEMGRRHASRGPRGFEGLCMNVAAMEGGVAFNVVPTESRLVFSLRPPPGADMTALEREIEGCVRAAGDADRVTLEWRKTLDQPPLATRALGAFRSLLGPPVEQPLDLAFWTEAALLAAAGIDAVVFGPGDIAQAHAADEFVAVEQLEGAGAAFTHLLSSPEVQGAGR